MFVLHSMAHIIVRNLLHFKTTILTLSTLIDNLYYLKYFKNLHDFSCSIKLDTREITYILMKVFEIAFIEKNHTILISKYN